MLVRHFCNDLQQIAYNDFAIIFCVIVLLSISYINFHQPFLCNTGTHNDLHKINLCYIIIINNL